MSQPGQTAILIFSHRALQEARRKRLSGRNSYRVSHVMVRQTVRIARQTGLPIRICWGQQQRGKDFGERLANALEDVFQEGFQRVLLIGNDSPGLSTNLLHTAANQLEQQDLVLGPDKDGGIFLLGIQATTYQRETLLHWNWETSMLQKSIKTYIQQVGLRVTWLTALADIDTPVALDNWLLQNPKNRNWRALWKACQQSKNSTVSTNTMSLLPLCLQQHVLQWRGPPSS